MEKSVEGNELLKQEERSSLARENTGNRTSVTRLMQGKCGGKSSIGTQKRNKELTENQNPENTVKQMIVLPC